MRNLLGILAIGALMVAAPANAGDVNKTARGEIDRLAQVCSSLPDGPADFPGLFRLGCGMQFAGLANNLLYRPGALAEEIAAHLAKAKALAAAYDNK